MPLGERDPHTGIHTTGHEWGGITELDTPVPRAVKFFYGLTFAVASVMWVLLPTWPLLTTYTPGLLGFSQRDAVQDQLDQAATGKAGWTDRIAALDLSDGSDDADARTMAISMGATLFADNCAVCHGANASGGPGFPNLRDDAWLWGGTAENIFETLRVGINSRHDEARTSEMPAFGRDQMLERSDILLLTTYVQHLAELKTIEGEILDGAKMLFAENCVACHGAFGKGDITLGAPDLTDDFWIYGRDRESLYRTLFGGRQGQMPHWDDRMSPVQLRILTLYVQSLRQW